MGPRTRAKKKGEGMTFRPLPVQMSPKARLEQKLLRARTPLERELLRDYKGALDSVLETHADFYIKHPKDVKDIRAFLKDAIKVALADPDARKKVKLGEATPTYRRNVEEFAREIDRVASSVELKTPRHAKKESVEAYQKRIDRFYNRPGNKRKRVYAAVRIMQKMANAGQFGTAREMLAAIEKEKTARKKIVPVPTTAYTYHYYIAKGPSARKVDKQRDHKIEIVSNRAITNKDFDIAMASVNSRNFQENMDRLGVTSIKNLRNPRVTLQSIYRREVLPLVSSRLILVSKRRIKPKRKRV